MSTQRVRLHLIAPLLAAITIYLAFALLLACTKAPWSDEGWFANPAYNLAFHGSMGTSVLQPSGHVLNAYMRGIQERTYQYVPNHLVALAAWFRVFGFSLFSTRAYSILWGIVSLSAFFYILCRLLPSPRVAQFTVLLLSVDFIFLWTAADGRPEAPANALALCALAAYLHFREQRLGMAVLGSQVLLATAVFMHPNALLVGFTIPVLAWRDDRQRFRPPHLLLAAAPYVLFTILWGVYISQSPADFKAQFFTSAAGHQSERWKVLLQPWRAVREEFFRHWRVYVSSDVWSAEMNPWMVFVPLMYLASMVWLFWNWKKREPGVQVFVVCVATILFTLTFLNGFKGSMYFHYVVPFYDAVLAAWLLAMWQRRGDAASAALVVAFAFVFLQVATSVMHIRADEYHHDYVPAIRTLEKDRAAGKTILGTAALGFGLHFQGFSDDWRLGLYSHLKPDILVLDRFYRGSVVEFGTEEPLVYAHAAKIVTSVFRPCQRYGSFWIYERLPASRDTEVPPLVGRTSGSVLARELRPFLDEAMGRPVRIFSASDANGCTGTLPK